MTLVGFARTLRAAGCDASPDRVHAMVAAVGTSTCPGAIDVYWAGRLTLCAGPDDLDRYDRAFAAYFGGQTAPPMRTVPPDEIVRPVAVPAPSGPAARGADAGAVAGGDGERDRDPAAPRPGRPHARASATSYAG